MNRGLKSLGLVVVLIAAVTACASVPTGAGFGDVERTVAERTGKRVHWNRDAPEDQAATHAVRVLLAKELTPDTAVQIALLNNRGLQATYEELGIAQAALVQAGLLRNPVFTAGAFFPIAGGQPDLSFDLVQDFLGLLYRPLRRRIAATEIEAAKLRVTAAVLDLAAEARQAYYRAEADQQVLELLRQVVQATSASYEAARRLRAAGNITELDLASERALYESARLDLASAEARVIEDRERLNTLMGLWGADTQWTIAGRLPEIPKQAMELADLEKRAVAASLDLALARQEIEAAARRLGLTRATALIPEIEAGVAAEREDQEWELGPKLSLPLPLLDQGQARLAGARSELRRAQGRYYALAVGVRAAVRAARERLLAARTAALHYRDVILPLRAQVLGQTQLQYNAMQVGVFQLLTAKQQQIEAGRRYIEALRDYWLARIQLEQILSGRTGGLSMARPTSDHPAPLEVRAEG